jgi:hypothetical protein
LDDIERQQLTGDGARIIARQAVSGFRLGRSEEAVKDAVQSMLSQALRSLADHMSRRPQGVLFRNLADYLKAKLVEIAWLKSHDALGYLDPLLSGSRDRPITIATLNYDNSVELRASFTEIPCQTGLREWSDSGIFPRQERGVDLLKLHGSVTWQWSDTHGEDPLGLRDREIKEVDETVASDERNQKWPDEGWELSSAVGTN